MRQTSKRKIAMAVALTAVLAAFGSRVEGQNVQISPLNSADDLDLSGSIIYAINFGNNGNPVLSDIVFSRHHDHPEINCLFTVEGRIDAWGGTYPNTGNSELDKLLGGIIWANDSSTIGVTTSISIAALSVGVSYQLQLIFLTDHNRPMEIIVNDALVSNAYDPYPVQRSVTPMGGSVVRYIFRPDAETVRIHIRGIGGQASAVSGLVLTELGKVTFVDYGSGTTTELVSGKGTWQINWGQGPWMWSDSEGESLFGPDVSSILALQATAPAAVSADIVATLPIHGALTLSARDKSNGNVVIGTMTLSGTGFNMIDGNASRVLVDEGSGMFLAPFHQPGPELTLNLDESTGVFACIKQAGDWRLRLAGLYAAPLVKGVGLQDNIMAALGGQVPLIGGLGQFELTGQYEADESKRPQRFYEHGTGIALRFGAGGGLWDQVWTGGPWAWYESPAGVNATFLGNNVSGELETTTAGAPMIDQNLVLSFDFGGHITLVSHSEAFRDGVGGQILGDVDGVFVADLNAARATTDTDGNIVIAFGYSVHDAPDALITVTEATGVYADIRQAGQWAWYVNGSLAIARLPDLAVQDNIMAALQNNDLILHAEEEFVLTGWYYRDSDGQ